MTDNFPIADPPRVVLFGRSGAGKSSLLGALLQAGRTQSELLGAEVVDLSHTLGALRNHVYDQAPLGSNRSEIVPHSIRLRPWRTGQKSAHDQEPIVLVDSDGSAANSLLKHPDSLANGKARTPLAQAVEGADALLLVVPAAAGDDELDATFHEFHNFLDALGTRREHVRDVGGLPVTLVLTQCDRLAQAGDTVARWQGRIEERKAHVLQRFADYLDEAAVGTDSSSPYLSFGSIDLSVSATAIRWPSLADAPPEPDEPFGVTELFRGRLAAAREHRGRAERSDRWLRWTIRGVAGFAGAVLAGLLAAFALQPPAVDDGLEERVRAFRATEGDAAVRLSAAKLPANARRLSRFRDDPQFDRLSPELREFVDDRLREIGDYRAYLARLREGPAPAEVRTLEELKKVQTRLTTELALPAEYAWGETEAAELKNKWLRDVVLLRQSESAWCDWYQDLIRRSRGLEFASSFDGAWRPELTMFLTDAESLPFKLANAIPGSRSLPQPGGAAVTYAASYEFDRVYQARRDWDHVRDRLLNLRDLADALGLTAGPDRKPAVLDLPEPGPEVDSARLPGTRWTMLRQAYPTPDPSYPTWRLTNFPEPARRELERRRQRSFDRGAAHVHRLIRRGMGAAPEAKDNPAGWQEVGDRLRDLPYQDWGRALTLLARMHDPKAADPVAELAAFLASEQFVLELRGFDLTVPDDLREQRVVPAGPIILTHTAGSGATPRTIVFQPRGEGQRKGGSTVFHFVGEGPGKLTYRPGDTLTAELALRSGGQDFKLVWSENRSEAFQFERLERGARLVRAGLPPEPAVGVKLAASTDSMLPLVPVLLPNVRGGQ